LCNVEKSSCCFCREAPNVLEKVTEKVASKRPAEEASKKDAPPAKKKSALDEIMEVS
jgi:hypothetical protein